MTSRQLFFRVCSILAIIAAIYHAVGIFYPINPSPPWRHAIFVGVCLFCAYGFENRPTKFIYVFGVLVVQQFFSHGSYLIEQWNGAHDIHWISLALLLVLPVIFFNLIAENRESRIEDQATIQI
jgi:surface polysaccharide O-acyltransferase-like enzyme